MPDYSEIVNVRRHSVLSYIRTEQTKIHITYYILHITYQRKGVGFVFN
jgi:hypothetical protein